MSPEEQNPMVAGAILEGIVGQMPKMSMEQMAWAMAALSMVHVTLCNDQTNPGMSAAVNQFSRLCMGTWGSGAEPGISTLAREVEKVLEKSKVGTDDRIRRAMARVAHEMKRKGADG